eukprot:TRINITY_DN15953_c0_g1_i2.p1 TRINITY_DN15953_c0_g1~~TRINITY_DN15953_c0_g1_i2.p1  ORF type:complete len:531 (+),score=63.88 TRINITY_DN15953_c0_g1_i2:66-1595(+)
MRWAVLCSMLLPSLASRESAELQLHVYRGEYAAAKRLLELGVPQRMAGHEQTALMLAAYGGSVDMCELLLKHGADPVAEVVSGQPRGSVLVYALLGLEERRRQPEYYILHDRRRENTRQLVGLLLSKGARVSGAADERGRSALMIAAALGDLDVLSAIAEAAGSEDFVRAAGSGPYHRATALHLATGSLRRYVEACTELLGARESHDSLLHDAQTCEAVGSPLWNSVANTSAAAVGTLQRHGGEQSVQALLSARDAAGRTAEERSRRNADTLTSSVFESWSRAPLDRAECADASSVAVLTGRLSVRQMWHYIDTQAPFLLKGAATGWPCNKWSLSTLVREYADAPLDVGTVPYASQYNLDYATVKLSDFVAGGMRKGLVAFTSSLREVYPKLLEGVAVPSFAAGFRTNPWQWTLGGQGSGSPAHLHQDALNGICFGTKKWLLWPPSKSFLSVLPASELFARAEAGEFSDALEITQEAGDVVYVPEGWGHAVLNVGATVAAAFEFYAAKI